MNAFKLLGACCVAVGLFLLGYGVGTRAGTTEEFKKVGDGTYRVYDLKRAFDTQTGEPVYWMIGGKMTDAHFEGKTFKDAVEPARIAIYSIPRKLVENLADDGKPDPNLKEWKLTVQAGKAKLLE